MLVHNVINRSIIITTLFYKIPPHLPLPKGGTIPLFGKEGIGEIFRRYVFSIMDSLVKVPLPCLTFRTCPAPQGVPGVIRIPVFSIKFPLEFTLHLIWGRTDRQRNISSPTSPLLKGERGLAKIFALLPETQLIDDHSISIHLVFLKIVK